MTALVEPPGRLLTVAEYTELSEDDQARWELQEGKRAEYADSGIPYYWIVDLEAAGAVSLRACRSPGGAAGYVDDDAVVDTYTSELPYPLTIDLAAIGRLPG